MADGFDTMLALESLHLTAEVKDETGTTLMDLSLRRDGACLGRLQIPGWTEPADFVVADGRDYVRGTAEFWRCRGGCRRAVRRPLGDDRRARVVLRLREPAARRSPDRSTRS